jgi:formylglycine-generating enzyme required for sulfatase activity
MLLDELKQPQHRTLATLVRTPLLLTMLCEVYIATGSLPTNRGRLLQAFVDQRWDWEQQRYPDIWIDRAIQRQALARLAYAITESYGRGTSVSWEWAQLYLEESVPGIAIDQVRKLAHQADLLDILEDGKSIQFSHQLIQEYFAAIGLQFEFSKWIHLDSEATQTEIQKYAAPGRRTGWEETLLILAGIEGETGHARELIRAFLSQPVQAARLLLARGNDVDPSLVEEHRMYCLTKITDSNSTLSERIEAGQALGLVGDPRFPVTIDEWQKEIFQCVNDFNDSVVTQQHILLLIGTYWCRVHSGKYRIGGWEQGQPYTDINLSGFWIARFPITVAQFAPFVEAGYSGQAKDWWGPNGWKWKNETRRRHPARWDERSTNDMSQPVTGVTWYEAHAFCTWLNELTQNTLPKGYIIRLPTEAEWETAAAYDALMQRRSYPWGEEEPTPERVIYESSRLQMPTPVGCCPKGAAACGASDMVGNVWEITTSSFRNYPEQSHIAKEDFTLDKMYASHDWNVPWRGGSWWSGKPSICCMARDRHDPRDVLDFDNGFRVVLATALNSNS